MALGNLQKNESGTASANLHPNGVLQFPREFSRSQSIQRLSKKSLTRNIKTMFQIGCKTLWIFVVVLLHGCSCSSHLNHKKTIKIGVDSNWHPIDFGAQTSYVNGFVEELLLEISKITEIEFEKIDANWTSLFEGMAQGHYQAVLSSLPPYAFHLAKYDFSENFLNLGPVMVVPEHIRFAGLNKLQGWRVGVLANDPAALILNKEEVIFRNYPSMPDVLEAIVSGEIEGALLDLIPVISYVNDLFFGELKIATPPLNDAGLRLIVLKGSQPRFIKAFNQAIETLKKKNRFKDLLKKWQLGVSDM